MTFNFILLQANQPDATTQIISQIVLIGGIFLVLYLFFILPQSRKQKEHKKYVDALKKNDSVVTVGGIHGKVVAVSDNTVTLEVDKSSKIVFDKSAVSVDASRRLSEAS